jgi:hypothetical protein
MIQKLKFHRLPTFFYLFSHIKWEIRDKERNKRLETEREIRDQIEEIKIKIRPSQLQTAITFDRKLRLRHVMQPQKVHDEIYKVNTYRCYRHFQGKKPSSWPSNTHLKFFILFFSYKLYRFSHYCMSKIYVLLSKYFFIWWIILFFSY